MPNFNKFPHIFQPLKVGNMTIKNRIEFTPMVSCHANSRTGEVTPELIEFLGGQARTGAAIVTIGATTVDEETGADFYGELSITRDSDIAGLSLLADEVHRYGAKISVEILHAGRGVAPYLLKEGCNAVGPSSFPTPTGVRYVEELKQPQIDKIIWRFADCAERLMKSGFDMVMLHGAHGNLIGQFLSPLVNKRTDWYGGSSENRMRFPLEIIKAIRERCGRNINIEYRISGDEIIEGGQRLDEVLEFLKIAQKDIDLAHISAGLIVDTRYQQFTIPPYYMPHCHNVQYAEVAKKVLDIPVTTVGSITTIAEAEEILAAGKADVVGMARPCMADSDIVTKAYRGKEDTIRPCLRCLEGCGEIFFGRQIRCSVNPVIGRESRYKKIQKADVKKKVMVVGGGPAGMMATQTLIQRGHDVVLFEKSGQLGGLLHEASALPFKGDLRRYLDWDIRTTMNCGADIRLNTEVTPKVIEEVNPDALVVALGSSVLVPKIPGVDGSNVVTVTDVDTKKVKTGQKVVVCGGGLSGMECALGLAMEGKDVTVVDMVSEEELGGKMFFITKSQLMDKCKENNVKTVCNVKVEKITEKGVEVIDRQWKRFGLECDSVVIALGVKPHVEEAQKLVSMVLESYLAGDVSGHGMTIHTANHTAFDIAVEI
ncbi:FAD-dependent oxidoreductase [Clostridium magnum]|uniref:NADH oxidase n=1 Tax=Clostridium magnum DSM 2767 TaxID=1121326 RepID=A0A161WRJ3_9CLOT|nr:FAD-dependent oxidoreductase [Clostridium magnum]KZL89348.1 NADH oxidase [Clostridium magnum DSM 2767]SHJ09833.1 2,4-dienoyl-CoA reductase [Clostridium magnum DSM 2767]